MAVFDIIANEHPADVMEIFMDLQIDEEALSIQYPRLACYVVKVQRSISTLMGESKAVDFGFSTYLNSRKKLQRGSTYVY